MGMSKDEVIKGIIHHKLKEKSMQELNHDECFDCPYRPDGKCMCESIEPLLDDALALLKEQEAVEPETEKAIYDHDSWWYVCGLCKKPINNPNPYCPHCGRKVKWDA